MTGMYIYIYHIGYRCEDDSLNLFGNIPSFVETKKHLLDVQAKHTQTQLEHTGARVRDAPRRRRSTLYSEWTNP